MANNDLAIKFSNDVYATKKEVAEYMKTPMIDAIWNTVLEYRNHFQVLTKLRHITGSNYSLCLTPAINNRINNVERKLMKLYSQYLRLVVNKTNESYKRLAYKDILETIAKIYNLSLDEVSLNRILNKNISSISPELMVVYHYYLSLENIENNYLKDFDKDTFKNYLSIIQGTTVNTFRTDEINNSLSKSVINKLYLGIPTSSIDKSMNDLILFLNDQSFGMVSKAVCALYYVYYVKPLEIYSEEISILTLKQVLANQGLDEVGATINFECLLESKEELEKYILESQKSLDLTYLLDFLLKKCDEIVDHSFKLLNLAKSNEIHKEIFEEDKTNTNIMPDLSDLEEKVEVKNSQINVEENQVNMIQNVAIDNLPTGLSESDAKRLEEHLLEINPNLSHGQAYFYARHCTVGMAYTIAQYKKEVGCAYETARSSMDNLVYLGYYRKELLKNKFIYIPVKRNK